MTHARRVTTLVGLALALVVPNLGLTGRLPAIGGLDPAYAREIFWWGLLAIVVLYVLLVERRGFASIGFKRPTWRTFVYGFLAAIVAMVGIGLIFTVVFPALGLQANTRAMNGILQTPLWFRVLLVTRAAVMEETLFRGYGFERLNELLGNRWVAAALSWAAFTLAHLSGWGWAQLLIAGFGGLVLTVLYVWRRDLIGNMTAHWLTDAAGFLLPRS